MRYEVYQQTFIPEAAEVLMSELEEAYRKRDRTSGFKVKIPRTRRKKKCGKK